MFIPIIPSLPRGQYRGRRAKRAAFAVRARECRRWRRIALQGLRDGAVGRYDGFRFVSSPALKD